MITQAGSPAPRNAPVMMSSLSIAITLREGCDAIRLGLDLCEDCVIRVGRDAEPVAGEVHVVNLAVCVVAPECRGKRVLVRVVDCGPGVGGRSLTCTASPRALRLLLLLIQ